MIHPRRISWMIVWLGPVVYSCTNKQQASFAPPLYYAFSVVDSIQSPESKDIQLKLTSFLDTEKGYYLSDFTADQGWPYYGEVNEGENVLKDTLMMPHLAVHYLTSRTKDFDNQLVIYLRGYDDTNIFFSEEIIEQGGNILVKTPIDRFGISGKDTDEIASYIGRSAIRSTFK